jgi:UrcA family protein
MFKQIIIASFAAAIGAAASAQAQTPASDTTSVAVSVAGLDMSSEAGARITLRRIEAAAGKVCGDEPTMAVERKQRFEPCVHEVTARTISGLNNPRVAAMFDKHGARPAQIASAH